MNTIWWGYSVRVSCNFGTHHPTTMPLYIRHNVSWTPASLKEESFNLDDSDFIQDPDLHRDVLPQPYRMINKLLWSIIDDVWEHVNKRESERIAEASRLRPPRYQCRYLTEADSPLNKAECMSVTTDGCYIVLGLSAGLAVLLADTGRIVDIWADDNLHLTSVQTAHLADGKHVIATIDDMGLTRLYALAADHLHLLLTINDSNSEPKIITSSCKLSMSAEYLTAFMEKPSSQTGWLEVHKLPKDAWIKDLDVLISKAGQKETPREESTTAEGAETTEKSNEDTDDQQSQNPGTQHSERTTHKFAATTVHCKVSPPPELTGVSGTLQQCIKAVDSNCDVIGMGAHHMITVPHLEQRYLAFKLEHKDLIKYLPEDTKKPVNQPNYHYMQPGRLVPHGLSSTPSGQPGVLAVWWQHGTQVLLYSLNKQAKELERKPDVVVPVSSFIVSSDVSSDGTKLVLALDNNNLIIWDVYLGIPKGVKHMNDDGHVMQVSVLDPSICPQDHKEYPPYPMSTNFYVMVTMDTGQLYLVNSGQMTEQPKQVDLCVMKENEIPTVCKTVDGLPNLLLTCRRNGQIFLHDLQHGIQLCEITLPTDYEPVSPWQPVMCVGSKGRTIYIKGQKKDAPETSPGDEETGNSHTAIPDTSLFMVELYSYLALDKYMVSAEHAVPFVVHSTVKNRVSALLKERINLQETRVSRMQTRWTALKDEIDTIMKMREEAEKSNALSKPPMKELLVMMGGF